MDADVPLQAGHEGQRRNQGSRSVPSHGAAGTSQPEHLMTPVVANAAGEIMRDHGVRVEPVPGLFPKVYTVKLGIALHFDGSGTPCASGASVGYPPGSPLGSNKPTADLWKEIWGRHWPFGWTKDNFTKNLSGYYGYRRMKTSMAELLIEFGENSCPEQDAWLQPRLEWIGGVVAHFAGIAVGARIPAPAPFGPDVIAAEPASDPWDDDIAQLRLELAELRGQVAGAVGRSTRSVIEGVAVEAVDMNMDDLDHEAW